MNTADANSVAISLTGTNAALASLGQLQRNATDGTVVIPVQGVDQSTATSQTQVQVTNGGQQVALADVKVVIPKTQTHSVGAASITNTSWLKPGGGTFFKSVVAADITITVSDQFGSKLDPVYNGKGVVDEILTDKTGYFVFYPNEATLTNPDSFVNGVIIDVSFIAHQFSIAPTLTPRNRRTGLMARHYLVPVV